MKYDKGTATAWEKLGEGPFETHADAFDYAYAEVGVPWVIFRESEQCYWILVPVD
jgi:hypothetical protein